MRDAPANLQELKFPPAGLIDEAVGEISRRFADRLPNLSSLTMLLPNLHAAVEVKRALRRVAGIDVLLLPRFATLSSLAETVFLHRPIAPASLRLVQLYSALRARDWFDAADLWGISAELAQLLDELTRAQAGLPQDIEQFVLMLEKAYQAKPDAAMRFEARLAHEMWYAFNRIEADDADAAVDAATAYKLRLAALASEPVGTLCAIGLPSLAPAETAFLHSYARQQPVLVFNADETASADPLTACLLAAWAPNPEGEPPETPIKERAEAFRLQHPDLPLRNRLALCAAAGLEEEALAASHEIRKWLAEGKRHIALVAIDRLTARRVRALLEREDVLLADESGWTLSTTSASTVIMRLLDVLTDGFYHRDVLDFCKSPFFAADWTPERRKRAVHRLESRVRQHNVVAGLERFLALVAREAPGGDEADIMRRLQHVQARLRAARRSVAEWVDRLLESLAVLGAVPGLLADAAGRQLLDLLALRRQELAGQAERMSLAEWRRWLNAELETASFRDDAIDSPVVLTTLAATRLRRFDAAVLVGADATHLNAVPPASRLFNQSVRRELGLPGAAEDAAQMQRDLLGLLARCGSVLITWQASKEGEHNAASPWVARLEAFHAMAYGETLRRPPPASRLPARMGAGTHAPAPSLPEHLLPGKISASGYASLMACPYQFFARHALGLNEQDEVAEEMEKRDYGELVHDILARFHRRCPSVSALAANDAETALRGVTDEVFRDHIENNFASLAWKLRWEQKIPSYLAWQRQREQEGWRFDAAEEKFERPLALDHDLGVTLHGRVDRIDRSAADDTFTVLDYKAQNRRALADKLKQPGEDVQLMVYALLLGDGVVDAAYVGLDDEKGVAALPVGEGLPALANDVGRRLIELLNGVARGDPLPAQGAPEVCRYCEMRGLCRLDYWGDET